MSRDNILKVWVDVDPEKAILAGNSIVGIVPVELDDEALRKLSLEQREAIAASGALQKDSPLGPVSSADISGIMEGLRQAGFVPPRTPPVSKKKPDPPDFAKHLLRYALIHGSKTQIERAKEGLLPENEALDLLRDNLFADLDEFPRFRRITKRDLRHNIRHPMPGSYEFDTIEHHPLVESQWALFKRIQSKAPKGATALAVLHTGYCATCYDITGTIQRVNRVAAKVVIEWHGRPVSREFALD